MTRIVLHIGTTKTGTSSLQGALHCSTESLAAAGVLYPSRGRGRHDAIAHHNLCYEIHDGRRGSGAFDPNRGTWNDVIDEIRTSDAEVVAISSEAFFTELRDDGVKRLALILQGFDVRVVVYVRRQTEWLQSGWNQLARFGRAGLSFPEFFTRANSRLGMYDYRLVPWVERLGMEHVDVIVYDDVAKEPGVVADFSSRYLPDQPLDPTAGPRRNTKAGLKQLAVVAHVVHEARQALGADYTLSTRSAKRISQFFAKREDLVHYSAINFSFAVYLYAHYRRSNDRVVSMVASSPHRPLFRPPTPSEFTDSVGPGEIGLHLLDGEEREFADRLRQQVIKHSSPATPVRDLASP